MELNINSPAFLVTALCEDIDLYPFITVSVKMS